MIYPLLKNIDSLDFNDAELAIDYGNLFINCANTLGWGIGTSIAGSIRSEMLRIGKKWLTGVKLSQRNYTAAEELMMLSTNDLIYRIVWSAVPDPSIGYEVVRKAFDARIHGDKEVDIYELYRQIHTGLVCYRNLYCGKTLEWMSIMLASWYKEFKTGSYCNPRTGLRNGISKFPIADSDILNRVSILLQADLWAFEPDQKSFKKRLFDNHIHYVDDMLSSNADYDIDTLMALCNFINTSWPMFITEEEKDSYRTATFAALSAKTDSPYLRASLKIMQKAEKQMA